MYRITRSRHGISTIIGACFFITIMLLAFNLMLWEIVQYDSYQQGLDKMAQRDRDRLAERLEVSNIFFTATPPPLITIEVRNTGGISINIVRIYFDSPTFTSVTIVEKGPCKPPVNHNLTGGFLSIGESGSINIRNYTSPSPLTATGTYTLTFVTERGNLFTSYYPKTSRFQSSLAYTFKSMRTRYAWSASGGSITYTTFNNPQLYPWQNASIPYNHLSDVSNSPDFNIKTISGLSNYYAWQIRILFCNIAETPIYIGNSSDVFMMSTIYQLLGQRAFQVSVWATLNVSQSKVTSDMSVPYEQAGTTTPAGSKIEGWSPSSFMGWRLTLASGDYAYLVFTVTEYFCTFATTEERDRFTPFVFAGTAGLASPVEYAGTPNFYCGALLLDGFQVRRPV